MAESVSPAQYNVFLPPMNAGIVSTLKAWYRKLQYEMALDFMEDAKLISIRMMNY